MFLTQTSKDVLCVVFFDRSFTSETQRTQTVLREPEKVEQHVTAPLASTVSMLRLRCTLLLCFWWYLLLVRQAVADEDALWGPTPPRENPPETKRSWFWTPSLPKFLVPFFSSSDGDDPKTDGPSTTAKGLTLEVFDQDQGSGDDSGESEGAITSQELLIRVTTLRGESLPTGTSDSPHSSSAQTNNVTLVFTSHSPTSSSITGALFTDSPTSSTNAPQQNATHSHPPPGITEAAVHSMGAAEQHLPEEEEEEEKGGFTTKTTVAPETTVPTALTWAAAQTTSTRPRRAETTQSTRRPLRPFDPTTSVGKPQDTSVSVSITTYADETTMFKDHSTRSQALFEARSAQPVVSTAAVGIDHTQILESITSSTQRRRDEEPITAGRHVNRSGLGVINHLLAGLKNPMIGCQKVQIDPLHV